MLLWSFIVSVELNVVLLLWKCIVSVELKVANEDCTNQ